MSAGSYPPMQQGYAADESSDFNGGRVGLSSLPPDVEPPPNLPPGARYQETLRGPNGAVIDRYVVPQRGTVPVRSVVPEQQQYQVKGLTHVPETRHIQVPKTVMVPEQYTVMVPQVKTRMVPKTTTETRTVTVNRPVETTQTMVRMVNKVVEGQKIVSSNQFLDYERPKMIQGKFLGARQGGIQEVGVQWTGQYYSGGERVAALAPPQRHAEATIDVAPLTPPRITGPIDQLAGRSTRGYESNYTVADYGNEGYAGGQYSTTGAYGGAAYGGGVGGGYARDVDY